MFTIALKIMFIYFKRHQNIIVAISSAKNEQLTDILSQHFDNKEKENKPI
jgi:hypothetical protein